MIIKMLKINRFKWFPFIVKEVIFEIRNTDGSVYEQPMSNGWGIKITEGIKGYDISVDNFYSQPLRREWEKLKQRINCLLGKHYPILQDNSSTQMMCGSCRKYNL
jgi:hypothetical protein